MKNKITPAIFEEIIAEHQQIANQLYKNNALHYQLYEISTRIIESVKKGGQIFFCGNGGSAADAQHLSTELISKFKYERKPINSESLTVNTSILTAVGNDFSFDKVFSRQIDAKGKKGDVLVAISTSGYSQNVIEAVKSANKLGLITIGLTGNNCNSPLVANAKLSINVPSSSTPRIQEMHILIGHIMCEYIEKELFKQN